MAQDNYIVGFGYYCAAVGSYDTFHEALRHYAQLRPVSGRSVRGLYNAAQCDVDDTGLTDEQQAAVDAVELGDSVERVLARYDLRVFAAELASRVWGPNRSV